MGAPGDSICGRLPPPTGWRQRGSGITTAGRAGDVRKGEGSSGSCRDTALRRKGTLTPSSPTLFPSSWGLPVAGPSLRPQEKPGEAA